MLRSHKKLIAKNALVGNIFLACTFHAAHRTAILPCSRLSLQSMMSSGRSGRSLSDVTQSHLPPALRLLSLLHNQPGSTPPPVPPRRQLKQRAQSYHELSHPSTDFRDLPKPLPRRKPLVSSLCTPQTSSGAEHYSKFHPQEYLQPFTSSGAKEKLHFSAILSLEELAECPHYLPATIQTIDGFYGFGRQLSISAGDRFHVHSVKEVDVAVLCDHSGTHLHIPFSSPMKFGLFQEPIQEFQKVSDISRTNPYVICCQQYIPGQRLEKGEILILKRDHLRGSQGGLICHSLSTGKEKHLHHNCKGLFTTAPEMTSMHLADLYNHLPHLRLPCKVFLYPPYPPGAYDMIFKDRVYTFEKCITAKSLVASNTSDSDSVAFFDIILDENISQLSVSISHSASSSPLPPPPPAAAAAAAVSGSRKSSSMPGHYARLLSNRPPNGFHDSSYTTLQDSLEGSESETLDNEYEYVVVQKSWEHCSTERIHFSLAEINQEYLKTLSMHEVRLTTLWGHPLVIISHF